MTEPDSTEPDDEITLEEWIAASQSCCGVEPESRRKKKPTPPSPPSEPGRDGVQSGDAPRD